MSAQFSIEEDKDTDALPISSFFVQYTMTKDGRQDNKTYIWHHETSFDRKSIARYRVVVLSSRTRFSGQGAYTVQGLRRETEYAFRFQARNEAGSSNFTHVFTLAVQPTSSALGRALKSCFLTLSFLLTLLLVQI